jgi:hypothetical protein
MRIDSGIRIKGSFEGILRHADGTEEITRKDNLIVNAGFDHIFDRLFKTQDDSNINKMLRYIAVGTSTNESAVEQTKLGAFLAARPVEYFHTDGTKECKLVATFPTGTAIGAITEAAVCFCSDGMPSQTNNYGIFDRVTFPVINKLDSDVYVCTFKFVLGELKD